MSTVATVIAILTVSTLFAACGDNQSDPKANASVNPDAQSLQGDWQVNTFDLGIPDVPPATPDNMILRFSGDKYLFVGASSDAKPSAFSLDSTSTPKIFRSFPPPGSGAATSVGTYELNGDSLRLTIAPPRRDPFEANIRNMTITATRKR